MGLFTTCKDRCNVCGKIVVFDGAAAEAHECKLDAAWYTTEEGGLKKRWDMDGDYTISSLPENVHSIGLGNGDRWDRVNGWNQNA
jgi:hypothetical protein